MPVLSRRSILELASLGFGRVVLSHLLADSRAAASSNAPVPVYNNLRAREGHFPGRAKAVIQLIQNGGPSQMDLFDPKPMLAKMAGKPHPDGVEIHQPGNENTLMPTPFEFRKYGQCGMDISEALPQQAEIVDKLCFIRSMHTEHNNHLEGLNMLLTCKIFPGRPVMGAWISYALGNREPEPSRVRGVARPEGLHHRRQAALGQRLLAGALSRRGIQYERVAGSPSRAA